MSELMRYPQFKQYDHLIISYHFFNAEQSRKLSHQELSFISLMTLTFKLNSHDALCINFKEDSFAFTEKPNIPA